MLLETNLKSDFFKWASAIVLTRLGLFLMQYPITMIGAETINNNKN